MEIRHRGRVWQATPTGDDERPYRMTSGLVEVELVRLSRGRPEELTPMVGTHQQTARYGLFTDADGELCGLDP